MAADVVAIHGGQHPLEPDAQVIETLENLLARAKTGELRAIAYGTYRYDGVKGTGWEGSAAMSEPLAAVIGMLQHRYFGSLLKD